MQWFLVALSLLFFFQASPTCSERGDGSFSQYIGKDAITLIGEIPAGKVNVFIEFVNSKKNHLGMPLPAGKVRVYKQDPDDKALEFIGGETGVDTKVFPNVDED